MSENRLPPDAPLRVTLLTHPLLNYLRIARPEGQGCATCGRPWTAHQDPEPVPCEQCGLWQDYRCYWRHTALTPAEQAWMAASDEENDWRVCHLPVSRVPLVKALVSPATPAELIPAAPHGVYAHISTQKRMRDLTRHLEG
jgi:hypothetical protein